MLMITSHTIPVLGGLLAVAAIALSVPLGSRATGAEAEGPQLAHMVYFKLKDNSGASRAKLVASCKLLLNGHEGTVSFATGTLAGDFTREVNDRDFDVSLHLVFVNKAAHDKYQEHPRHLKFIEENKENWEKVRVFDSYLSPAPPAPAAS
jgi:stress responsive alpha/beta barrel protein